MAANWIRPKLSLVTGVSPGEVPTQLQLHRLEHAKLEKKADIQLLAALPAHMRISPCVHRATR